MPPDFFNAKLRINRTLWVGNVSVMESASDWYLYVMDKDRQCSEIERRARQYGSWDAAYFVTIARTFGMGFNGDLMEQWAASIPMEIIEHHADDLFQLEARTVQG